MLAQAFKKMAGTSAVFLSADFEKASPVEREGKIWTSEDLQLEFLPKLRQQKPSMANVLALEGLEDYDMPENGDVRWVESIGAEFIYFDLVHGWVQLN